MLDKVKAINTTAFSHVKPGDTAFRCDGLRGFFLYRDLGVAAATGGKVLAQWVIAHSAPEKGTGFQRHSLARGELRVAGRQVDTRAIRRTAMFTVEGERDDLCAIGETVATHDLCSNIRPYMKTHHVQLGVGHYGVFSGKRWQHQIYPRVREMIQSYH